MPSRDRDRAEPRHRKPGRAHKRGAQVPGRRVLVGGEVVPPGAYPVENLAGMSPGAAALLLRRAALEEKAGAATYPHFVIIRHSDSGAATSSEPFSTGLEALTTAYRFLEGSRAQGGDQAAPLPFTLTVAPQLPGRTS
ncbi:MAG: hypothetical protein JWP74_2310 [Marmoricola sp.]|nr:hypothetical protein [Marmoricola sp.]